MAASGAQYGVMTAHFYWVGAIPAMVFLGVFMMPMYYGSKARSVPEYLKLRFDERTRAFNSYSFAILTISSSGISMHVLADLINRLLGWNYFLCLVVTSIIVLLYVLKGGLTSAMYTEVLQFFMIVFGIAPLGATMLTSDGNVWVIIIAAILVVLMTASQFITQLQIMSKNQSAEMKASPMYRQQRILLYVLPLVFLFSGVAFPLGVMFYWFVSNIWTMVQQFIVIRNMPTPGSEAALAREARLAKKRQKKGIVDEEVEGTVIVEPKKTQRQQPVGKNRAKKKGGR